MNFSFRKKTKKQIGKGVLSPPELSRPSSDVKKNKRKKFRASKGAKYALTIGDEGAILIYVVGKTVKSRNFIASANSANLKEFEKILAKDPNAPIFVIVDSMDQNFVQQSLPPISALGVKKLIKRRLARDLGGDVIKGYVLLDRDVSGRRDWNFMMVSLEDSPHLKLWFDFVEKVDNRLNGIYLLSVEAENIIKNIDYAIGVVESKKDKKNKSGTRWKFLVNHNKVGGFRQVILRDGRAIFTRLTQPVGEVTPDVIAGNIEQEIVSTIEYMKRMSFDYQQGLDIYIVASDDINKSLDLSQTSARNIYKFTPFEVAEFFGITGAAEPYDQFGDAIMSACISCSKIHRLVLSTSNAFKVNKLYNMMQYQRVIAGLMFLVMIGYGGVIGLNVFEKYSEIEDLNQSRTIQQRKLYTIKAEVKKSGIDITRVNDIVFLYKQLVKESKSPLPVLMRLQSAVTPSVVIRDVLWEGGGDSMVHGTSLAASGKKSETITLVLRFPEISNTAEAFSYVARKTLRDVRAVFPDYKVVYKKLPDVISKKSEGGDIIFDKKRTALKIDKASLEATLLFTKKLGWKPPLSNLAISNVPLISTDEFIGMGE